MEKTKVELDEREANLFIKFRQLQDVLEILENAGVFSSSLCQIVINKGVNNTITRIDRTETPYLRKAKH